MIREEANDSIVTIWQGSCVVIFWAYIHTRLHTRKNLCIHKNTHKKLMLRKAVFTTKIGNFNSEKCSKIINQCKFFLCISKKKFLHNTLHKKPENRVYTYTRIWKSGTLVIWYINLFNSQFIIYLRMEKYDEHSIYFTMYIYHLVVSKTQRSLSVVLVLFYYLVYNNRNN